MAFYILSDHKGIKLDITTIEMIESTQSEAKQHTTEWELCQGKIKKEI